MGELAFAEWAVLKKIFNTSSPLLRAAGGSMKLILSPLPRYVQGKCCDDKQHITNYRTTGYATEMGNSLAQIYTWLGDLAVAILGRFSARRVRSLCCYLYMLRLVQKIHVSGISYTITLFLSDTKQHEVQAAAGHKSSSVLADGS